MARVTDIAFEEKSGKAQPTTVSATVRAFGEGPNGPVLQIDTFGSEDREFPGKVSQTLQFDRTSALKLREMINRVYGLPH